LEKALDTFVAGELPQTIETFHGENGWEVNSHNIMLAGNTIIISVLIQRRLS